MTTKPHRCGECGEEVAGLHAHHQRLGICLCFNCTGINDPARQYLKDTMTYHRGEPDD